VHGGIHFFERGIIVDYIPNGVGGRARDTKQGSLQAPGLDHAVGQEFVADGLTYSLDQVHEPIFFARIDGVVVPESERLHLRLSLLGNARNAGQQHHQETEK
jgi:hypothetical protein